MSEPSSCFHCGLEVKDRNPPTLEVFGEKRRFCCAGCHAVCAAIVRSGNEDYYRFREGNSATASAGDFQDHIEASVLFDQEEVQGSFVQEVADAREAFLLLEDIRCAACVWLNERHIRALPGVLEVQSDYAAHRLRVRWDPEKILLSDIIRAIARIGYIAHPYDATHSRELAVLQKRRSLERILFAGILGMVVMQFSLASYIMGGADANGDLPLWQIIGRWTGLLAATAILAWPGQEFFIGAWRDLRGGRLGMDVPVVIGLTLAWVGSAYATWQQRGDVYLDSIAMFVFLLLVSRHLELRGRMVAARSLDKLNVIIPEFAYVQETGGDYRKVPVSNLQAGDKISIRPGQHIPVDGTLVQGQGEIDESLITGEFAPVNKLPGDLLLGGSINGGQHLLMAAAGTALNSCVNRIADLARKGSMARPRVARISDMVARYFVLIILVLASATALYYWLQNPATALETTIAVLIVTCPCALSLATPVATALAAARLTEAGIVPLHMESLGDLASVDTVILDKTGTMTVGRPHLDSIKLLGELDEGTVLSAAAALERQSEHPLARAFNHLPILDQHQQVEEFALHHGLGISGRIDENLWSIGAPEKMLDSGSHDERLSQQIKMNQDARLMSLLLVANGKPVALFGLSDKVRPGLRKTVLAMQEQQLAFHVLSGDTQASVDRLVQELDVPFGLSKGGLQPENKVEFLNTLRQQGRRILMVGDGINDSPVLAHADVSISFHSAPDLAKVNSDFLISASSFEHLMKAREIASKTRRIIFENFSWAAAYNLLALPAAMAGLIPAWGAAIGMSLSSALVVMNSLRL